MNRTIKDATVKRFHYDSHDQLRHHLRDFIDAYNFGRRLKTLKGLTPYEFIWSPVINSQTVEIAVFSAGCEVFGFASL